MTLVSRSFIRKRAISFAATTWVAGGALAWGQDPRSGYHLRAAMPVQYVTGRPDYSREQPFLSANDAGMSKMMSDMTIKPTGDADRDFIAMMVPHHEGAIEREKADTKYAHNLH